MGFWGVNGGKIEKCFGQENEKQYLCAPIITKVRAL
jgi:hypothetical protein